MEVQVPAFRFIPSPLAVYNDSARSESNFTKTRPDIAPIPSREFNFVGYHYNTIAHKVFPTEKLIKTIQAVGAQFLRSDPNSAQQWASLLGLLSSTEKLVPLGRMHLRELQYCLKSQSTVVAYVNKQGGTISRSLCKC